MTFRALLPLGLLALLGASVAVSAQDARNPTEPAFPTVCTAIAAETTISAGEPASETLDTLIQPALSSAGCANKAVELTLGSGGQNAFVIKPIAIPSGVTLIVDGGVTVFGSLVASDYQASGSIDTCGINANKGDGCYALIYVGESTVGAKSSSSNSGLMGYGVINGRGGDHPIVGGTALTKSWWDLSNDARSGPNQSQNNPNLVQLYHATNALLYKITLLNSPHFHVRNTGSPSFPGFTVWGLKLITPFNARNTDGVDPTGVTNMTVTNSVIGDGDDEIAISGSSASTGFSFTNLLLASGHGISIGSDTSSGVSNVLASNVNYSGQPADSNQIAFRLKSYCGNGGTVQNVTFQNACVQGVTRPIVLDPTYSSSTGSNCPQWTNIAYKDIHVLSSTNSVYVDLRGLSTNPATISLDNVVFDKLTSVTTDGAPSYLTITDPTQVYPSALGTLNTAPGATAVSYTQTPTISNASARSCPTSGASNVFPQLVGELYASTAAVNNVNSALAPIALTAGTSFTLRAMVQPVNSERTYTTSGFGNYTGVPAPSAGVQFYDGAATVGSVQSLTANGTLASLTVASASVGTHNYTAKYVGDGTYTAQTFGALTVNISAGPASQVAFTSGPPATLTYGNSAGTVTIAVEDAGGNVTASTAQVTLTVTGPNSYSQTYNANAVSGTATFNLSAVLPGVGAYNYAATSSALSAASASETVNPATLTVTGNTTATRIYDAPNPVFGYAITGFVNGDNASVVSGAPSITTTAPRTAAPGTYPTVLAPGTLSAANYNFTLVGGSFNVTGGAAQAVLFSALPNFPHGGSYQLTARSTSGIPVTYTASGPATVSGAVLTVTGTGTVTVTASSAANTNYAAAANVSQSFTAQ